MEFTWLQKNNSRSRDVVTCYNSNIVKTLKRIFLYIFFKNMLEEITDREKQNQYQLKDDRPRGEDENGINLWSTKLTSS